jgi:hypothetical protein
VEAKVVKTQEVRLSGIERGASVARSPEHWYFRHVPSSGDGSYSDAYDKSPISEIVVQRNCGTTCCVEPDINPQHIVFQFRGQDFCRAHLQRTIGDR